MKYIKWICCVLTLLCSIENIKGQAYESPCMKSVACEPFKSDWVTEINSVIKTSNNCSAVLVNNSRNDGTPYVLIATHCVDKNVDLSSIDFMFHYQYQTCNPISSTDPASTEYVVHGATLVDKGYDDIALLRLNTTPQVLAGLKVSYAGVKPGTCQ